MGPEARALLWTHSREAHGGLCSRARLAKVTVCVPLPPHRRGCLLLTSVLGHWALYRGLRGGGAPGPPPQHPNSTWRAGVSTPFLGVLSWP